MQSKRFRSRQFYVGDLVSPNWTPKVPLGFGLVLEVDYFTIDNHRPIKTLWQSGMIENNSPIDLILVEQVLD